MSLQVIIIPALDILEGECVRLKRGDYREVKRYSGDPAAVARRFAADGARWIHVVDLDAAAGRGRSNRQALRGIRRSASCLLEVGGGIRSRADVEELLGLGADRLVLGTVLVRDPLEVERWCERYGPVFMAGIDALEGRVRVTGWQKDGELEDGELARRAARSGVSGIVYTSIGRDGTLQGPDIGRTNRVAELSGLPVILSGGIGCEEDVEEVFRARHPGVQGIILGKALYEERLELGELLRRYG